MHVQNVISQIDREDGAGLLSDHSKGSKHRFCTATVILAHAYERSCKQGSAQCTVPYIRQMENVQ